MEEQPKREVGPQEKNKVKLEPLERGVGPQEKDKGKIEFPREEFSPPKVT
jgi:hypothetical protein